MTPTQKIERLAELPGMEWPADVRKKVDGIVSSALDDMYQLFESYVGDPVPSDDEWETAKNDAAIKMLQERM